MSNDKVILGWIDEFMVINLEMFEILENKMKNWKLPLVKAHSEGEFSWREWSYHIIVSKIFTIFTLILLASLNTGFLDNESWRIKVFEANMAL